MKSAPAEKVCARCGRPIAWRRKWAHCWDRIRYCGEACRRRRRRHVDDALEQAIVELLEACAGGATICPSEAARRVDASRWRDLMEPARQAARRLVERGAAEILQHGRVVAPGTRGPIRIRLLRSPGRAPAGRG